MEQYDRLKAELEQGFADAEHRFAMTVPPAPAARFSWKAGSTGSLPRRRPGSMSLSPKDMDFIEAKHVAAREIALALGVPPMLIGIA